MANQSYETLHQNILEHEEEVFRRDANMHICSLQRVNTNAHCTVVISANEFERLAPEELRTDLRTRRSSGWRTGILLSFVAVLLALIFNCAVAGWLARTSSFEDGVAELYSGDCSKAQRLDTMIHLVINILSTMMLSGSNYTMQVLAAPTREEIENAHKSGKWLNIGVPSLRNLFHISRIRATWWFLLMLSSLPLHLMFNSVFYTVLSTNDYNVLVVNPSFLEGADFYLPSVTISPNSPWVNVSVLQSRINSGSFERLDNADCIYAYAKEFLEYRRNLVIVSSNTSNSSSILNGTTYAFADELWSSTFNPFSWLCDEPHVQDYVLWQHALDSSITISPCRSYITDLMKNASTSTWAPFGLTAEYCLSEKVSALCSVNVDRTSIIVVLTVNAVKAIVMLLAALCLQGERILVIGDAIQSFLVDPDESTKNMCLLTQSELKTIFRSHHEKRLTKAKGVTRRPPAARTAKLRRKLWLTASDRWRRRVTFVAMLYPLLVMFLLYQSMSHLSDRSWSNIKALGFGSLRVESAIPPSSWSPSHISDFGSRMAASSVLANTPQVGLSLIYFVANSHLTAMFAADEWSGYALQRKSLRVSMPRGQQRSTCFLSLPYGAAILLMVVTATLHWLVSQSIFLAVVSEWSADGQLVDKTALGTCGLSILPMILGFIISAAASIFMWALGLRKYNPFIPLAGSCGLAIAASCHAPPGEEHSALLPLKWGAVTVDGWGTYTTHNEDGLPVGHCCFSSREVETPIEGHLYAGMRLKDD